MKCNLKLFIVFFLSFKQSRTLANALQLLGEMKFTVKSSSSSWIGSKGCARVYGSFSPSKLHQKLELYDSLRKLCGKLEIFQQISIGRQSLKAPSFQDEIQLSNFASFCRWPTKNVLKSECMQDSSIKQQHRSIKISNFTVCYSMLTFGRWRGMARTIAPSSRWRWDENIKKSEQTNKSTRKKIAEKSCSEKNSTKRKVVKRKNKFNFKRRVSTKSVVLS